MGRICSAYSSRRTGTHAAAAWRRSVLDSKGRGIVGIDQGANRRPAVVSAALDVEVGGRLGARIRWDNGDGPEASQDGRLDLEDAPQGPLDLCNPDRSVHTRGIAIPIAARPTSPADGGHVEALGGAVQLEVERGPVPQQIAHHGVSRLVDPVDDPA